MCYRPLCSVVRLDRTCKLNLSSFKKNSGKIQPNSSPQRPYTMDILLMKSIQDQVLDLFKDEISTRLDKIGKKSHWNLIMTYLMLPATICMTL